MISGSSRLENGNLGPNRGTQAKKEWKQRKALELNFQIIADPQIAVEQQIRVAPQSACPKIHQKERKIIKHVASRDPFVEFDSIEQDRLPLNEGNVAQMKITMAAANLALFLARHRQGFATRERLAHGVAKS